MNLKFHKVFESELIVIYWITTEHWDKSFMPEVKWIPVKGLCIFDKNTQKTLFDPEKTHAYFFERTWESVMIEIHLQDISKKQKGFPDISSLTTGG